MKSFSELSALSIDDTEVHLFYRLDSCPFDGPATTLGDLVAADPDPTRAKGAVVPADQIPALQHRYASTPIWERTGVSDGNGATRKVSISPDLDPVIVELLSGARPDLVRRWHLSQQARALLQTADLYETDVGRDQRVQKALHLAFSAASTDRLAAAGVSSSGAILSIEDLEIIAFSSGGTFLVARVAASPVDGGTLSVGELAEVIHAISRINSCRWHTKSGKDTDGPTFRLGTLLRRMAQGEPDDSGAARRVASYAYANLHAPCDPEDLDTIAAYLSRRYTSDYALDLDCARLVQIREFSNVRHSVAEEGLATIVAPREAGDLPGFLCDWTVTALRPAYLPLVLLNLHESWFLTEHRSSAVLSERGESDFVLMDDIVESALHFRLHFRFSGASDLTMHNQINRALRTMFDLDRKLSDLEGDVGSITERLDAAKDSVRDWEADQKHRRFYWVGVFSGAALGGLTGFSIAKEVLSLLIATDAQLVGWLSIGIGFFVAAMAWHYGHLQGP